MRIAGLLFCCVVLSSCIATVGRMAGLNDTMPSSQRLEVAGKDVYFLGMMHLARPEFYANARQIVKDFESRGYTCYLESASGVGADAVKPDTTALLKLRKITGLSPSLKYSQEQDEVYQKLVSRFQLVDQPRYDSLGVSRSRWVDIGYPDLIRIYEFKHGVIALDSCDFHTALGDRYNCSLGSGARDAFMKDVALYERNRFIAQTITQSADKKILVIYGKAHLSGLREALEVLQR